MVALAHRNKAGEVSGGRLYAVGIGFISAALICLLMFSVFEYIERTYSPKGFEYVAAKMRASEIKEEDGVFKVFFNYEYIVPKYYLFTSSSKKTFATEQKAREWLAEHAPGDEMKVSYNVIVPEYTTVGSISIKPNVVNYIAPIGFVVFSIIGIVICWRAKKILKK